ncbi:hypothetical protein CSUB01_09046 [Colletotrichum sublineola]|uniref:Uncharacterized protein n=1 Tax=Colletotrichum sublineola TaxID=1173701 RepID=A0A066XJB8_COLSU|nr:hypothetical protein CSUB01_09046 [Colletotrichum sublineola]
MVPVVSLPGSLLECLKSSMTPNLVLGRPAGVVTIHTCEPHRHVIKLPPPPSSAAAAASAAAAMQYVMEKLSSPTEHATGLPKGASAPFRGPCLSPPETVSPPGRGQAKRPETMDKT